MRGNTILRTCDRVVGVPAVRVLGALRRSRPLPNRPTRIGLLKSGAIGDTVLLSAIVQDLVATFGDAQLVFFAGSDNAAVARLIDGVDRVVTVPLGRPHRAIAEMRRHRVDVLVDFGAWPRVDALLAAGSGAAFTLGFRTTGQHRHFAYDATVEHLSSVHELDNYRRLVATLGVEPGHGPRLRRPDSVPDLNVPGAYATLHLFAGGYHGERREWPAERWHALVAELVGRGIAVVITGSPAEGARAREFVAASPFHDGQVIDVAGRLSIEEAYGVVAGSVCVVSVNTGLMHLAAAAGTPTVALNGPTSEVRWGPVGESCVSVNSRYPGCGFLNLGSEYAGKRGDCMLGIDVDDVVAALDGLLAGEREQVGAS